VLRVAADLSAPGVGEGLSRLERARPDTVPSKAALKAMAEGGDWRTADAAAATRAAPNCLRWRAECCGRSRCAAPRTNAPAAPARAARQRPPEAATTAAGEKGEKATTPSGKRRKTARCRQERVDRQDRRRRPQ
jgi:hypothetical protein